MATHPLNLAFRFLLELLALFAYAYWGWTQFDGISKILIAVGAPVLVATLWATFNVANDPSRSGKAPVPVAGIVRLLMELALLGGASALWFLSEQPTIGLAMFIAILMHYALSYDRILWLIER